MEQIALENDVDYWESVIELVNNVSPEYNINDAYKLNSEAFTAENKLQDSGFINSVSESDDNVAFKYNLLTLFWTMYKTQSILDDDLFDTYNYTDRLSEITIPSLVLWGKHDMVVPPLFAQEAFDNLGSAEKELVIFENSGHSPMGNEPELFAEKVIQFINKYK